MGMNISFGLYNEYLDLQNPQEAEKWSKYAVTTSKILGYLTSLTNCLSCFILYLVIRHAYKLTHLVRDHGFNGHHDRMNREQRLNTLVTSLHAVIIFSYTVLYFLTNNVFTYGTAARINLDTALVCLSAVQDIFLAYMMFFVLDEENSPTIYRDETRHVSYVVLNVIKSDILASETSLNESVVGQREESEDEAYGDRSLISDRMIA